MSNRNEKERNGQSISDSLEADRKLLPHMPYLLQDMWTMGCSLEDIVEVVGSLSLPSDKTHVLDLGCGKGAILVHIAAKYGFKVTGIDIMEAFLDIAREKAGKFNITQLSRFIKQDILEYISREHDYDLVILASLGGILGNLKDTVSRLRTQVKTGGYILIDDGYLSKENSLERKGFGHYRNHEDTINELTACNELLITEVSTTQFSLELNEKYLQFITKRGGDLAVKYPELEKDIKAYINLQSEECDVIRDHVEGALWLLQKGN